MTTNVGGTDRMVRYGVAVVALIGAYLAGFGTGLGIALLVVAVLMAVTGTVRFCPLYRLIGMNTCRAPQRR